MVKFFPPDPGQLQRGLTRLEEEGGRGRRERGDDEKGRERGKGGRGSGRERDNVCDLSSFSRYLFALQVRQDLSNGSLTCNDNSAALLVSHILQCKCLYGDIHSTFLCI